jgi:hypothetical protein
MLLGLIPFALATSAIQRDPLPGSKTIQLSAQIPLLPVY